MDAYDLISPDTLPPPQPVAEEPFKILLGHTYPSGEAIELPLGAFGCHLHVLGKPKSGKSFLLNSLAEDVVTTGWPSLFFIDPHGDTVRNLKRFCIAMHQEDRLIVIDPQIRGWSVGINPLAYDPNTTTAAEQADIAMSMFAAVFRKELLEQVAVERWLFNTLICLAKQRLTLAHLPLFLHSKEFRWQVIDACNDIFITTEWREFEDAPKREQTGWKAPLFNRINKIVMNEKILPMFAVQEPTFDPLAAMDSGKIVLCDLSSLPGPEQAFIGRALINLVYQHAQRRPEGQRRPCLLFCDEFHKYMTNDLSDILLQLRKFGVSCILAHQELETLRQEPKLYSAVNAGCDMFISFRCSPEDAKDRVPIHFTGALRDDIVIEDRQIYQTKQRPIKKWETIRTKSQAETEGEGNSLTESENETEGKSRSEQTAHTEGKGKHQADADGYQESDSDSAGSHVVDSTADVMGAAQTTSFAMPNSIVPGVGAYVPMQVGNTISNATVHNQGRGSDISSGHTTGSSNTHTEGSSEMEADTIAQALAWFSMHSKGRAKTKSFNRAKTQGWSEALVPWYDYEEFSELSSQPLHTIEALKEYATAIIAKLPQRFYLLDFDARGSLLIKSPWVEKFPLHPELEQLAVERIMLLCANPTAPIERQLIETYARFGLATSQQKQTADFDEDEPAFVPKTRIK